MRQPSVIKVETLRDQAHRFANVGVVRIVVQIRIERAQHRDAGAQHIHRMRLLRHEAAAFPGPDSGSARSAAICCVKFAKLLRRRAARR